jgi:Transposase IS116/IS110/IS902 family
LATSPGSPTRTTSHPGTAPHPIDASSGDHVRHRLSRAGNRQINRVLHIMATVQLRNPTEGRAYFDRKKASGKTSMEAMRCLKRRLSDIVYRHMTNDAITTPRRAREGNRETTPTPARPAHIPLPALRTSHFPDPPDTSLRRHSGRPLDTERSQMCALINHGFTRKLTPCSRRHECALIPRSRDC